VDRALADDLRATLVSARDWVREWLEEGVELWPPVPRSGAAVGHGRPVAAHADAAPVPAVVPVVVPVAGAGEPTLVSLTLDEVRTTLGDCQRCRLAAGRTQIVFGDGDPAADLMLIGEAPGEQEDLRGVPFVGRAGELLTQMIEKGLRIPRSSVYICNIVKCRPPNNRTPLADEVGTCRTFLDGQIAAVQPKVILALGKPATSSLLGRDVAISRVRGTWQDYRGTPVMPTFHPAYLLRQYTEDNRRLVWDDLKQALARARALGGNLPALP
jgi:DNA polymerase